MAKLARNNVKRGIDEIARGARKATDAVVDAHNKNKKPSRRAADKIKGAADRAADKVAQVGSRVKGAAARAKSRAKRA